MNVFLGGGCTYLYKGKQKDVREWKFLFVIKNKAIGDWTDDLVVMWMTHGSYRVPEFGSQQTHWVAHNCL